ncbi:extracellular solute-binding protein [Martelella lutilitoris]|uniref:Extracellular solute-binding protein n=1 Tax=Martelella lutilitoris TaxID=2583532 RepID=A0A5C4JLS0_9HYPH|nr:extracellular solute-binding protein [Martelella lutilitoris]TNB46230.1 extracellular solute-binding protein [Martelella lutilitoris]
MSDRFNTTRRIFLAASAAASMLAFTATGQAFAEDKGTVITSVFGGDYGDILRATVDEAIMEPEGYDVIQDISSTEARQTKLRTEKMRARSSFDVAVLADLSMYQMAKLGVLSEVTEENVPRVSAVIPALRKSHSVPQIYSYFAILYNPDKVTTPPTSYADLWNPEYKGKVGVSDNLHVATSAVAALVGGGSMTDFTPGQAKLLELRDKQDVQILPSNEAVAAAFESGDIWITINYVARAYSWRQSGLNIERAVASEGAIPIAFEMAVPKNAPNKDGGFAYLNAALEPEAQIGFAAKMGYLPTVTDAELPAELEAAIGLPPEEQDRLIRLDDDYLMQHETEILDFWNREFKG